MVIQLNVNSERLLHWLISYVLKVNIDQLFFSFRAADLMKKKKKKKNSSKIEEDREKLTF